MTQLVKMSNLTNANIVTAKIDCYRAFPFVSHMVMTTRYIADDSISTCGASVYNGTQIHVNQDFWNTVLTTDKERNFVLLHEVLHIFLQHMGRARECHYNHKLYNIAADYCINSFLVEMKSDILEVPIMAAMKQHVVGPQKEEPTPGILYDVKYKGMSSDEIYHKLLEENDGDMKKTLEGFGDNGALDEIPWESLTEDEKAAIRASIGASFRGYKSIGNHGEDALVDAFKELIEPSVPWKTVLQNCIELTAKNQNTYSKWNRRSKHIIFPSRTGNHINLAFYVDTSGSMSDADLSEALSELQSLMGIFDSWEVSLLSGDTKAHLIGSYDSENGDSFATVNKKLIGGGGTDMQPAVEYVEAMEDTPNALIIVTDGFIPVLVGSSMVPTFVIITRNGNRKIDCVKDAQVILIK